jgi:ribosome-associated protein
VRNPKRATIRRLPQRGFIEYMKKNDLKKQVTEAIAACQDKKAEEVTILQMEKDSGAFTDYFVVCSGTNPRQIQAISD